MSRLQFSSLVCILIWIAFLIAWRTEPVVMVQHLSQHSGQGVFSKIVQVKNVDYSCKCLRHGRFMPSEIEPFSVPSGKLRQIILDGCP